MDAGLSSRAGIARVSYRRRAHEPQSSGTVHAAGGRRTISMGVGHAPRGRAAALALAALAVAAVLSTGALAAGTGPALTLRECFADAAGKPCQRAPHRSLELAADVAVSPDGKSVYVAAGSSESAAAGAGAITEFARRADGTLQPTGCLTFAGSRGCRAARIPLEGVRRLAISPDGRDLYAVSDVGLVEFSRGDGGRLRPLGCIALAAPGGRGAASCERPAATPRLAPNGLALSPDGADLYVTGVIRVSGFPRPGWVGGIYELARRADGSVAPAPIGCLGPAGASSCTTLEVPSLEEPVVSPDGSALYAVGYDAIERFPRAADGSLGAPSCLLGGRHGCGLGYPTYDAIAIAPDGSRLYLGAYRETVAYSIAPTGALTKVAASPIGSDRLALSPDGTRLYGAVYGTGHGGIRTFAVGDDALSPLGGPFRVEGVEGMALVPGGGTLLATSSCACDGALLALSTNRTKEAP